MTVGELKKELEKYPDNTEVYTPDFGYGGLCDIEVEKNKSFGVEFLVIQGAPRESKNQ